MPLGLFDRASSGAICDQPQEGGVRHRVIDSTGNTVSWLEPDLYLKANQETPLVDPPGRYADRLLIRLLSKRAGLRAASRRLPLDDSVQSRILSLSPVKGILTAAISGRPHVRY
jgi:hypothetical protein